MENLTANANEVIDVLLNHAKEQERTIAILQVNLEDEIKKNKDLQKQLDEAKAKLPATDQQPETNEDPNNQ